MSSVLLTAAYFPPVQYFAALSESVRRCIFSSFSQDLPQEAESAGAGRKKPVVYIEACENYQKQSYRNRCHFYSASGMQSLSFPVVHGEGTVSLPITEIRVDYSRPWLQQHKRAIVSAYRSSAYFEYYQDDLFAILDSRPETLWDLDISLTEFFLDRIGIPAELRPTDRFAVPDGAVCGDGVWKGLPYCTGYDACDLREVIHPKRPDDILHRLGKGKPYFQVFARKYGFIGSLSVMDLLFNEGPDSISYII